MEDFPANVKEKAVIAAALCESNSLYIHFCFL